MIQDTVKDKFDSVRGFGTDEMLAALGLERRRSLFDVALPAAGLFFAGLAIGAGVAFLVAPRTGRDTRRALKGKATDLSHRLSSSAESMAHDVKETVFGKEESRAGNGGEKRANEPHRPGAPQSPNAGQQK